MDFYILTWHTIFLLNSLFLEAFWKFLRIFYIDECVLCEQRWFEFLLSNLYVYVYVYIFLLYLAIIYRKMFTGNRADILALFLI